jgi:hypothetical protein
LGDSSVEAGENNGRDELRKSSKKEALKRREKEELKRKEAEDLRLKLEAQGNFTAKEIATITAANADKGVGKVGMDDDAEAIINPLLDPRWEDVGTET